MNVKVNQIRPFFWQKDENGKEVLNQKIHHLAMLRNDVMHGFFVLPPEKNREEATNMETILSEFIKAGLFSTSFGDFHFYKNFGFSGKWNIVEEEEWKLLESGFDFAELARRISYEYSDEYIQEEKLFARESVEMDNTLNKTALNFLKKGKGALLCWYAPNSEKGLNAYRNLVQSLENTDYHPIYYALQERGATFTWNFLEKLLSKTLREISNSEKEIKEPLKFLKTAKLAKKPVLILHNLHIGLFNNKHITKIINDFYDASLPILATSWYYPYMNRFVNAEINLQEKNIPVNPEMIANSLHNYIRFKGLSDDKNEEKEQEYLTLLENIVAHLFETLQSEKEVFARRFADANDYPMEFVHEAFSILTPLFQLKRNDFIRDEVDELYGFPKTIEESSRIYLSLGRRDLKLEYKHKVLTLNQ